MSSVGMGPWTAYRGTFYDDLGATVTGSSPLDLSTPQPFLFRNYEASVPITRYGPPLVSMVGIKLLEQASLLLPVELYKQLANDWRGTNELHVVHDALSSLRDKCCRRMASDTLMLWHPECFASNTGVVAVKPVQRFEEAIGPFVLRLIAHFDPNKLYQPGQGSPDTATAIIHLLASGSELLDVMAGDSDITQKDLRRSRTEFHLIPLLLTAENIHVRMATHASTHPNSTVTDRLRASVSALSAVQEGNLLARRMETNSLSNELQSKCPQDALSASDGHASVFQSLKGMTFPISVSEYLRCPA